MTSRERVTRFLTMGPVGEDLIVPVPAPGMPVSDLFPESLRTECARCGEAQCWQLTGYPEGPARTFTRLIYHCEMCQGDAGIYLLIRWTSPEREALALRKVAQYLPPGRDRGPAP